MERSREGGIRRGFTTDTASAEASPFASAFASATLAAGGGTAANITVLEASVVNADRMMTSARLGPSASMPAPGTSGVSRSTTSVPVCRPIASPATSASASYGIRTPPGMSTASGVAGAPESANSGGTLLNARLRSSATDFFMPAPTASSGVSRRRIQRLLQKIDSVCSGTSVVGTNVLYDYPRDYEKDAERLYGKNSLERLDEQEFQQLLMMLPASPEVTARVDMTPPSPPPPPPPPAEPVALVTCYGDAAAAAVHRNSDGGLTASVVPSSPPQVRLPTYGVVGGAAESGTSIDRDLAAIVPKDGDKGCLKVRGEVLKGELGLVGTGAPVSGPSEVTVAKAGTVAEPPEQLIELTLRPLVGNLTAVSEVCRSPATALIGRRTEPGGGDRNARGGGEGEAEGFHAWATDGGAATGWPSAVGGGGGSNGNQYVKVLRVSSGNCSSDSAERELSLRQLVARGSVDRGRGSMRPVGSASTSASLTLASQILDDATATTLASRAELASTPPPPSPLSTAQAASTAAAAAAAAAALFAGSESLGPPLRSRSHKAWGSGDGSSCGGGGSGDGVAKVGATLKGTGGSDSDRDSDSDVFGDFLGLAVGRPVTATAADRRRCVVSEQVGSINHGTIDGPFPTRQRRHQQQLQQYLQQANGSEGHHKHGEQEQLGGEQQQQDTRTMLRGRSHHWAPLHPKPPSRPRRASAQNYSVAAWAATAAQPPRSPPLPSPPPQSPPLPSPPPPRSAFAGGDGAMPSSPFAGAVTGLDADGGSSLVVEPRRGAVPTSPLQARLFVGSGRSNRSLSEPSSSLRDPIGSGFKSIRPASPPSSLYGSGGGADDEDNNSPSSDWDFEVRQIGLTAPGVSKLAVAGMPSPPSAPAATAAAAASRPSAAAALETAANLVALIDEDLNRNTTAVSVSSGTRTYQDSLRPLSPLPPDPPSLSPTSPPPIYPHPPPAFPLPWPPSATAAAPSAAEATAMHQRGMCGRSQRRLATSQPSLKHSSFGSRLETLEEEGHQRSALSAAGAAADAVGDSSSSSSGGGGRPWSTASGTSNTDGIGGRRQPLRNSNRRSTSSTPRHLHRRRRLTGEPGESSGDGSSSGSSDDEYLQALFRPLRHAPPHDFANNLAAAHLTGLTLVGQAPLRTAQIHPGANSTLPSTASSELRSSHSFGFHSHQTGHHVQPPPAVLAPPSPPLPPPSPPPLPQQQHHDLTWARRPSVRICSADSTGASGGAGAASGTNATVTTLAVYDSPGGRGAATTSAALAPQPPSLQVSAGVAAAHAAGESAAVAVYDRVGDGINGQLACADNASALSSGDSQVQPLNIDRIKRDLKRLLAE
ncbi:hypothetical protein Vafri_6148 [Volvox africanus]|uniref:Uncharacterized protein n=1 Tax=Volvox africanus TaxID=51714 RepID=A0A8J4EZ59_9CHLO|nr:hypothetical protein Vafri_6148 [Volvox africanus]